VQRALSLARYLPRTGHELHVLCCRNPTVPTLDPGLVKQIPSEVSVDRTFSPELPFQVRQTLWRAFARPKTAAAASRPEASSGGGGMKAALRNAVHRVFNPDPEIVWVPSAYFRARRIIREKGITTVIVTAPPFSSFLIGNRLKRNFPSLQLVADFRDDWFGYYLKQHEYNRGDLMARRARELERETVELADLVVNVTPTLAETMRQRYTDLPAGRFACVPNGFDPEAFAGFRPRPHGTSKIVVTLTGTVHPSSSVRPYFDALESLPEADRARFETRLIGRITPDEMRHLEGRKSSIRMFGFLPQAEAFRYVEETDYLLVSAMHGPALTGKLFEYLASGKPIFATTPPGGEVDRLLRETGAGWCAGQNDIPAIRALLERAIAAADHGAPPLHVDREKVDRYSRVRLAAEYSRLIEEIRRK
jgi:glycosyltransferase involved in cell wall biosynthesis